MEVGAYTYGHQNITIRYPSAKLKIGKFCSISDSITAYLGGNHMMSWISTYPFQLFGWPEVADITKRCDSGTKGDIVIENDVWIGSSVTLMSGIRIGNGAVIGTMAVVASDIPPYCIAVGNPARVVKKRFDDETIAKLLKIAWWDWDINKIKKYSSIITSSNMQALFNIKD